MDSTVTLAILGQAETVFGSPGMFLSLPDPGIEYKDENFDFLSFTNEKLLAFYEFSKWMDQIPRGPKTTFDEQKSLSGVYASALSEMDLAVSTRNASEEAEYQAASGELYTNGAQSEKYKLYRQYREAFFTLQAEINNQQLTADLSNDPAVKSQWVKDEPVLKQQKADLELDWQGAGRFEIERALQAYLSLGAKSPATTWHEWRARFEGVLTDTQNREFWPSAYSPSTVLESGSWLQFSLPETSIKALAARAPAELKTVTSGQDESDIQSLSFECTSIRIERPWFEPGVFSADYWRLSDNKQISDGTSLQNGSCPAYIAAVVLARNVTVKRRPSAPTPTPAPAGPGVLFGNFGLGRRPIAKTAVLIDRAVLANPIATEAAAATAGRGDGAAPTAGRPGGVANVTGGRGGATPASPSGAVANVTGGRGGATRMGQPARVNLRQAQLREPPSTALAMSPALLKLKRSVFDGSLRRVAESGERRRETPQPTPSPQPTPAPDPTVSTSDPNRVFVLAFICKRIPLSPHPNPALTWGD